MVALKGKIQYNTVKNWIKLLSKKLIPHAVAMGGGYSKYLLILTSQGDCVMKRNGSFLSIAILLALMCSTSAMALVISGINPSGYSVQYNALGAGALVYTDRTYTFLTGPASFVAQTYIKTC